MGRHINVSFCGKSRGSIIYVQSAGASYIGSPHKQIVENYEEINET